MLFITNLWSPLASHISILHTSEYVKPDNFNSNSTILTPTYINMLYYNLSLNPKTVGSYLSEVNGCSGLPVANRLAIKLLPVAFGPAITILNFLIAEKLSISK